ncbi:MAG TPA: ABC transporter permease [Solirubrobacteraceae bacterium]|jgi:ABC-2 type transport system permease protein|nr:ABC transporter permease [Solirubrobacteraceae bacterium]
MRAEHVPWPRLLALQIGHHLRLLRRSPLAAFSTLALPVMCLLAVGLLNDQRALASRGGIAFAQFATPGMAAFAIMDAGFTYVLTTLALARERGIMLRVRSTPMPTWVDLVARMVTAGAVALASAAAVVGAGALAYDVVVPWDALPSALLAGGLGLVCFAALGAAASAFVRTADSAFAVAWGILLPVLFVSDVFLPLDGGPAWLRAVASAFPARHLALALEDAFNPVTGDARPEWSHLAMLAAWAAGATLVGALAAVSGRWLRRPRAA